MAEVINYEGRAIRLAIWDVSANSSLIITKIATPVYAIERDEMKSKTKIYDIKDIKEAAWDKVVAFIEESHESIGYDLHYIDNIFVDYLTQWIMWKSKTIFYDLPRNFSEELDIQ